MLRARLVALLASLLVLWPVGAPAHARYFCRMMDRVLDSCCCPRESERVALHSEPEVRSPDCCVRLTQGALPTAEPPRHVATPGWMPARLASRELDVTPAFQSDVLDLGGVAKEAVLARGPPLFLKHCVFLI
ncbi:MAG: hypothetical protein ABI895_40490 [Deltaproteobacteria bacterium]